MIEKENEGVVRALLELANRHESAAIHTYLADAMHATNPSTGVSAPVDCTQCSPHSWRDSRTFSIE